MVARTLGSHRKEGTTKMGDTSMEVAGIDTGKDWLDVAMDDAPEQPWRAANTPAQWDELAKKLTRLGVGRVGIEASGGYEAGVVQVLRHAGLQVQLCQPAQVRLFARLQLRRAKNDQLDAQLIAAFTAQHWTARPPADPRYQGFTGHLGYIEQIQQDIARLKTRLEHQTEPRLAKQIHADVKSLTKRRDAERARLEADLRRHPDIGERLDLVLSIDGIGLPTALALIVRMPELGHLSREQAAALAGLAPYDDKSGRRDGQRHIAGGRTPLRTAVYAAALPAAFRWNRALSSLYRRLIAKGKSHKLALIACARKLIIFANTVLQRGTPWTSKATQS